ncbi:hypothetical protein Hanom_Chr12g01162511 [Helianthus anomalus]
MTLNAAIFREGNFRLPMSKFLGDVLTRYGIHISQVNALVCFTMSPTLGVFYSFNSRTAGVLPCSQDPPKSLHVWKQKFFNIRRGVIPIDMHYLTESEGVPRVAVSIAFADVEWYKILTRRPTPIIQ